MAKKLYAVIIGINSYPSIPLNGCVNDAMDIVDYFQNFCKNQDDLEWVPQYLLAPNSEDMGNIPALAKMDFTKPTRQNIIAAFDHFKQAQNGDYCLLYYSGHGSTVTAPKEFKGFAPGDTLQTIVCVDSRINGVTDLLDKELGYLIASAMEGKSPSETQEGVHFLSIADSCHSGTVTRGGDANGPVARMAVQGPPLSTIHGFDPNGNVFYAPLNGRTTVNPEGGLKPANHISLSGARDNESAYEIFFDAPNGHRLKRGVFTWSFLEALRQGGVNLSYGEIIRRAEMAVRARVDNQIPQLGKTDMAGDNLMFFKNAFKVSSSFPVMYERGQWRVGAGTINGWQGPEYGPATVQLDDRRIVPILSVESTYTVLDSSYFTPEETGLLTLTAKAHQMPFKVTVIGFSPQLPADMKAAVEKEFATNKPMYGRLAQKNETPRLLVALMKDKQGQMCYVLTRPGSETPLFMRTPNVGTFLTEMDKVLRYEHVLQLDNPQTNLPRNTVKIEIKTLQGVEFDENSLNNIPEEKFVVVEPANGVSNPDKVSVSGVLLPNGDVQIPAIKVRVVSQGRACFVGALYCDSTCGINPDFLPTTEIGGDGTASYVDLQYVESGRAYRAIPLMIDEKWSEIGVTETQDYLIIFVSTKDFSLSNYKQSGIELDTSRAAGFGSKKAIEKDDWFTIKIPIEITIPQPKQKIQSGGSKSFGAFTITAPAGFTATAEALTPKNKQQGRGTSELLPPSLWDGVEGRPEVFARGIAIAPDAHISIVELTNVQGTISKEAPLVITPGDPLHDDESILPIAYDAQNGIYYPVGYTDDQGRVCINELPQGVEVASEQGNGTRSVTTAFKFYFQKMVWSKITGRPNINRLSLLDENGVPVTVYNGGTGASEETALAAIQAKAAQGNVLLVLHGIIGDLEEPMSFFKKHPEVCAHYGAILMYEYENLNTPIEQTAALLLQSLKNIGTPEKGITILAHSMGGLVSRYMIEQLDGAPLIGRLIQLGTPNAGSEVNDFREKLFGWITLGLNGVTAFKPYLGFVSTLWKGLDGSIFHTLKQMDPESEFLAMLNSGGANRQVPYFLVAGNTSIIESSAGADESVYKQVLTGLKERGVYILADYGLFKNEPNDMAVRVKSMQSVPGGFAYATEVACDHISYYSFQGLKPLLLSPPVTG